MPRGAENREAGESPARSRHCKQESIAIMSLSHREGSNGCLNCEPGDLPELWYGNVEFQITRFDCTELYFDNPTASICVGFSFSYHFLFIHRIWKKKGGYEK